MLQMGRHKKHFNFYLYRDLGILLLNEQAFITFFRNDKFKFISGSFIFIFTTITLELSLVEEREAEMYKTLGMYSILFVMVVVLAIPYIRMNNELMYAIDINVT